MDDFLNQDRQANTEDKPAFRRLKLLPQIDQLLKNHNMRQSFIDQQGYVLFHNWLCKMPDGSLPNQKIVLAILQALDLFNVTSED